MKRRNMDIQYWRYHQPVLQWVQRLHEPASSHINERWLCGRGKMTDRSACKDKTLQNQYIYIAIYSWRHIWWLHRASNSISAEGLHAQSIKLINKYSQWQNAMHCYIALWTVNACPLDISVTHLSFNWPKILNSSDSKTLKHKKNQCLVLNVQVGPHQTSTSAWPHLPEKRFHCSVQVRVEFIYWCLVCSI